jgi:hypothetical protein
MTRTAAALLAALFLAACGGSEPDLAACEQAMRDQFAAAMAEGEEAERPVECEGVSDEKLEDIATQIIGEAFEEGS